MMAFWLAFTGSMFYLPDGDGRTAGILLGIYFFAMAYSPGEGYACRDTIPEHL